MKNNGSVVRFKTLALAGIDPHLHEAAVVDGASKWRRVRHIDIRASRRRLSYRYQDRYNKAQKNNGKVCRKGCGGQYAQNSARIVDKRARDRSVVLR